MKTLTIAALSATSILLCASAFAGDGFTPDAAFKTMLTLEGTWKGEAVVVPVGEARDLHDMSDTTVSFKNIGNSTVMQTFAAGTPAEMVSMYHQNGAEELIHTHYCAIGNQPSMAFIDSDEKGVIDFKFTEGTNMDVHTDPHAHDSYMKIIDADTYETRTANWSGGKLASYRYTTMKRVK